MRGFRQHISSDRATLHAGVNVSSGGCHELATPELWLRVRCATGGGAVSLRLPSCSVRVRALLYPIRLPVGYDQTMRLPLVPGALSDPSSRLVFRFALGDADIMRLTLHSTPIGCLGGTDGALPSPDNATAAFNGFIAAQREACPSNQAGGYLDGQLRTGLETGAPANATIEFFCTDAPGEHYIIIDVSEQRSFTEGPPLLTHDGAPTGSAPGAPLSAAECPAGWASLASALSLSEAELPRQWSPGGSARNVLRGGRLTVELGLYRSSRFGATPFTDGERRETCLSFNQLRTFSIATSGSSNATLHVSLNKPISAIYARRDALPDVANRLYDASITMANTVRWGCADALCAQPRTAFALTASSCMPEVPGFWYVSLALHSAAQTALESEIASAAGANGTEPVRVQPARFHVTMVLFPSIPDELVPRAENSSAPPTTAPPPSPTGTLFTLSTLFTLPAAQLLGELGADADAAAATHADVYAAAVAGRTFLGGGAIRHLRLSGIPRSLAPRVSVHLSAGTLRAIYLQPGRCATSSTGLNDAGTAESMHCGAANDADCQMAWMARFNPFDHTARLYEGQAVVQAQALSELAAAALPPVDWWIAIESTTEDVADVNLTISLLRRPAVPPPLCFFLRFCPDYDNPEARYTDGERDPADAIAVAHILRTTSVGTWIRQNATRGNLTTLVLVATATLMFVYVVLYVLFPTMKKHAGRWVASQALAREEIARANRLRARGLSVQRRQYEHKLRLQDQTVRRLLSEGTHACGFRGEQQYSMPAGASDEDDEEILGEIRNEARAQSSTHNSSLLSFMKPRSASMRAAKKDLAPVDAYH